MKKFLSIVLCVAAVSIVATASAQTAGASDKSTSQKGEARAAAQHQETMVDMLMKLNLSADQKTKLKALVAKSTKDAKALREDLKSGKLKKQDARNKAQELRKANQEAVRAILTKEQNKEFNDLIKEARKKREEKGG